MLGKEKVLFRGYQIYLMHQPNPSKRRGIQLAAAVLPPLRIGSSASAYFHIVKVSEMNLSLFGNRH